MIAQLPARRRGQFQPGNTFASLGGQARAAKLSSRRRRAIARKARRALVAKRFHGDDQAQRRYIAALGAYAYEVQAGAYDAGSPLRPNAAHPGTISEFLERHWQPSLLVGAHVDIDF